MAEGLWLKEHTPAPSYCAHQDGTKPPSPNPKTKIEIVNSSMGWVKTPHHEFAIWVGELRCLR